MKQMGWAVALAGLLAVATPVSAQVSTVQGQRAGDDDDEVTLTGCVVKGDGGYVLTNVAEQTTAAAIAGGLPSAPQPEGAVLPGRVLYWLKDDDDLEDHAGQRVEVRGEIEGDVEAGAISAEREGGLVELEFKIDGDKKVTIKVPEVPAAIGTSGAVGDKETDFKFIVRKFDVESVKTISSTCR